MNDTTSAPDSKRHWRYGIETDFDERDTLVHAPLTLPDGTRIAIVAHDHAPTRSFDVVVPPEHSRDGGLIALVLGQFGQDHARVMCAIPEAKDAWASLETVLRSDAPERGAASRVA